MLNISPVSQQGGTRFTGSSNLIPGKIFQQKFSPEILQRFDHWAKSPVAVKSVFKESSTVRKAGIVQIGNRDIYQFILRNIHETSLTLENIHLPFEQMYYLVSGSIHSPYATYLGKIGSGISGLREDLQPLNALFHNMTQQLLDFKG